MKKYIFRTFLFLAFLFAIDRSIGYILAYMFQNSKGGYVGHQNYITDGVNEDILIFGSSRAIHHYNPQILTDSLGLSCYNCGQDGNGIILFYGWWQIIREHYHPKIIVYDVSTFYDLLIGEDNHKFLGLLKESYDRAEIQAIFEYIDPTEKYKMISMMYRYNSRFHQILTDYIYPLYVVKPNGFMPLEGEIDTMRIKKNEKSSIEPQFDNVKILYLKKFIDETDGVKLIFVFSPMWYRIANEQLDPIRDICRKRNIPFIDYSNDQKYVHNNEYFKDGTHLNARGADEFTRDLVSKIKNI